MQTVKQRRFGDFSGASFFVQKDKWKAASCKAFTDGNAAYAAE